MKDNIIKCLRKLCLRVDDIENTYICWTANEHLLVICYGYDEVFEMYTWHFIAYNNKTINQYEDFDTLYEALKNYLGIKGVE